MPRGGVTAIPGRAALLAATLLLTLGAGACDREEETPVASQELRSLDADNVAYQIRFHLTHEGVREGTLTADTAFFYQDSSFVALRNLHLTTFTRSGEPKGEVTAVRGGLYSDTNRMWARGDVVLLIHEDRRRIETEELHYDPSRDRIWSDTASVLIQNGERFEGSSFESDLDFTSVVVHRGRGTLDLEGSPP